MSAQPRLGHELSERPPAAFITRLPAFCGVLVSLLGLAVLAGWGWHISWLKSLLPGLVTMKPNAAAAFVLAGLALWLRSLPEAGPIPRHLARGLAATVAMLAAATLSQDLFGWDFGLDSWLLSESPGELFTRKPGRMSPMAALSFLLLGLALLFMERASLSNVVQGLALMVGGLVLVPLAGYLFGERAVLFPERFTPMAMHTALGLELLAIGVLVAGAEGGFLGPLRRHLSAVGLGFAVLVLASAGLASFINAHRLLDAGDAVAHTYQVLGRLESLEARVLEIVAAGRGFVVTGRKEFLAPTEEGRRGLARELTGLRELVADNPAQQTRLNELEPLIQQRIAHTEESIRLRREAGAAAAAAFHATGEGERMLTGIRARVQALRQAEDELLVRRQKDLTARNASSLFALTVAGLVSLALLVGSYAAVRRSNRDLESRVRARTVELTRVNRALRTLSECNQALVRAASEPELLREICRVLVEHGGYQMGWVGYAEHDEAKTLRVMAWAGREPVQTGLTWADTERGRGTTGTAIRTGQPAVINDLSRDPNVVVWRAAIRERGLNSAAALPLKLNDAILGVLAIGSAETGAFDRAEIQLLEELAGDLSFGIATLRARAARAQADAALRESENRFHLLFTEMTSGFALHEIICDAAGRPVDYRFLEVNRALETMTGLTRERMIGHTVLEVLPGTERHWIEEFGRVALTGERIRFENYSRELGKHFEVVAYRPAPGRFAVVCNDVSERKRAEHIAAVLARLAGQLNTAPTAQTAGELVVQAADELLGWDSCFLSLYDPARERVRPVVQLDLVDGQRRSTQMRTGDYPPSPRFLAVLREGKQLLLRPPGENNDPDTIPFGDKQRRSASLLFAPIRHGAAAIGVLSIQSYTANAYGPAALDTLQTLADHCGGALDRIKAAEALRESESLYHSLVENVRQHIFRKDTTGRFTFANTAFCQGLGRSLAEILGRTDAELFSLEVAAKYRRDDERVLLTGEPLELEEMFQQADGRTVHMQVLKAPLRDAAGLIVGLQGIAWDVTERKQAEAEIRRLNADLERRVAERTAQLREVNKELESFSYSVSHDLRAPLRHLTGYADLLRKQAGERLDPQGQHYLASIAQAAAQMGRLVDDLLNFSRTGRAELRVQPVSLARLVAEVRSELRDETQDRAIEWRIGLLPEVWADPALLRQALINLFSNAVKYTRPRHPAVIEVGVLPPGSQSAEATAAAAAGASSPSPSAPARQDSCMLFVRDNGVGFDMKYGQKLFGVFQRLHREEDFEGTGIGLATVQRIIARHGGRVWAEARVDAGATFYVTLPTGPTARSEAPRLENRTDPHEDKNQT